MNINKLLKNLFVVLIVNIILFGCQQADCTNGIQDGDETDIDCGGLCEPCPEIINLTPLEQAINGKWYRQETGEVTLINGDSVFVEVSSFNGNQFWEFSENLFNQPGPVQIPSDSKTLNIGFNDNNGYVQAYPYWVREGNPDSLYYAWDLTPNRIILLSADTLIFLYGESAQYTKFSKN